LFIVNKNYFVLLLSGGEAQKKFASVYGLNAGELAAEEK
jgi:hypothetical protein